MRCQWWTGWESNPRPPECKSGVLPTELPARVSYCSCDNSSQNQLHQNHQIHLYYQKTRNRGFLMVPPARLEQATY